MRGIVVVKIGGNASVNAEEVCRDVSLLVAAGESVVLVHGGSADIDSLADRLGVKRRRLVAPDGVSSRRTDTEMLEVVVLALAGAVKPRLLSLLSTAGVRAVGLTGLDAGLLKARRKSTQRSMVEGRMMVVRNGHGGRIISVDADVLTTLLRSAFVPVVSPPATAPDGQPVNVDADRAAAALAGELGAGTLVMLTGAPGVLADASNPGSLIRECRLSQSGPPPAVEGGMGIKLVAAREALLAGVAHVLIADGRCVNPLQKALSGSGTRVTLRQESASLLDPAPPSFGQDLVAIGPVQ